MKYLPIALLFASSVAQAESVADAQKLCRAMDNMAILAEPCEYSYMKTRMDLVIPMSSVEARKLCRQLPAIARQAGFDLSNLRVFIRSPYSQTAIAHCTL